MITILTMHDGVQILVRLVNLLHADLLNIFAPVGVPVRLLEGGPDLLIDHKAMQAFVTIPLAERGQWKTPTGVSWEDVLREMKHVVAIKRDLNGAIPTSVINNSGLLNDMDKILHETMSDVDKFCQIDSNEHQDNMLEYTERVVVAAATALSLDSKDGLAYRQVRSKIWLNMVVPSSDIVPHPLLTATFWTAMHKMLGQHENAIREVRDCR